ncbi:MAG: succinate dehydrogenase, cytochrome b556 subunit [Hyphomicrobiales bacterium]|nr:succinate dehydrogenase, cytochrome b556 subunit [Hyphomicrobiales bacterium]MBV9738769.1 succinate dehydrogenase, cytochrome b556 subunit [Hyphomicrobiales bacterium]
MSEALSGGFVRASRDARPRLILAQGHRRRGFVAALLHRLSGVALAIFLPMHFLALATSLQGANALEAFLVLTRNPFIKAAEWGLVTALALHLALGLRLLAIELLGWRERSAAIVPAALAAAIAIGLLFLLNAG